MKKFLKIVAIILVILALLLILSALINYLDGPNILSSAFGSESWLGTLSVSGIITLAIAGLIIAAVISPAGFSKGIDRVTSAVSTVGSTAGTMVTKALGSTLGGVVKGLTSGLNWLWIGAAAVAAYALWPTSSDRSNRAAARLEELRVRREEIELDKLSKGRSSTGSEGE